MFCHEVWEGMFVPGGGGACRTRGRHVRPACRGRVRWARASIGRCFVIGGDGISVRQSRGRYTEERPLVRCLDDSWALKEDREGKDYGSLAEAGFAFGGGGRQLQGRLGAFCICSRKRCGGGRPRGTGWRW